MWTDLGCIASNSLHVIEKLNKFVEENNLENIKIVQVGCFGLCSQGPIVVVKPEDTFYAIVKPEDVEDIINIHIKEGKIVERLLCKDTDGKIVKK